MTELNKIVVDSLSGFKSVRAMCEHHLAQIDEGTCVEFRDMSHINIRVYVSNFAKKINRKFQTKDVKSGIVVWLKYDSFASYPPLDRIEDDTTDTVAVFVRGHDGLRMRPYVGENRVGFMSRVLGRMERGHVVRIHGDLCESYRQPAYAAARTGPAVVTTRKGMGFIEIWRQQ